MLNLPRSRTPIPRCALAAMLAGAALGGSFAWGFFTHRHHLFPFSWLRQASIRLGWLRSDSALALTGRPAAPAWRINIPYLDGSPDRPHDRGGVLLLDRARAAPGWTLVTGTGPQGAAAVLLDLAGRPRWSWPLTEVANLHLARAEPDGSLLVVDLNRQLLCVDREGRVLWRTPGRFHHAVLPTAEGLLALRTRTRVLPAIHPAARVIDEEIVLLDRDGRELEAISVLDALLASPFASLVPAPSDEEVLAGSYGRSADEIELELLHANHVEPTGIGDRPASRLPAGYLVSIRNQSLLVLVERASRRVVWVWGPGRLELQHHPTILPSGNLLLFNNGRARSEVLELDPTTRRVVWSYRADGFFSSFGGSCQRLANGNTLITESATGHVFEVTPAGEKVWEWANPRTTEDGRRQSLYRATRYRPEELPFLSP